MQPQNVTCINQLDWKSHTTVYHDLENPRNNLTQGNCVRHTKNKMTCESEAATLPELSIIGCYPLDERDVIQVSLSYDPQVCGERWGRGEGL